MNPDKKPSLHEIWLLCLLLGLGLFNFPFIEIFNKDRLVFGTPFLYLFLFIAWALIIGIIYAFSVRFHQQEKAYERTRDEKDEPE